MQLVLLRFLADIFTIVQNTIFFFFYVKKNHEKLIIDPNTVLVLGRAFRQVHQNRGVNGVQRADGLAHRAGAIRGFVGSERGHRRVADLVHDCRRRVVHVLLDHRRHQSRDRHRHVSGELYAQYMFVCWFIYYFFY